jgi:hypothetical protein
MKFCVPVLIGPPARVKIVLWVFRPSEQFRHDSTNAIWSCPVEFRVGSFHIEWPRQWQCKGYKQPKSRLTGITALVLPYRAFRK